MSIEELIDEFAAGNISEYTLTSNLDYRILKSFRSTIDAARLKNQINSIKRPKNMKVIYICGKSGSGKTTVAKWLAEQYGYSYCISAAGRHMMDSYRGQDCLILDDFRSSDMKFNDLLKLLDNNTSSEMDARYNNKNMAFCKLLIITSIHKPNELYSKVMLENEPLEQFIRRLRNREYIEIRRGSINIYNADTGSFTGRSLGKFSDILESIKSDDNSDDIFDNITRISNKKIYDDYESKKEKGV